MPRNAPRWSSTRSRPSRRTSAPLQSRATASAPPGYYGYSPNDGSYSVHLCDGFWRQPLLGIDGRMGILVHEVSHLREGARLEDNVYGTAGVVALATSNPWSAIRNADTIERFVENTPELPMYDGPPPSAPSMAPTDVDLEMAAPTVVPVTSPDGGPSAPSIAPTDADLEMSAPTVVPVTPIDAEPSAPSIAPTEADLETAAPTPVSVTPPDAGLSIPSIAPDLPEPGPAVVEPTSVVLPVVDREPDPEPTPAPVVVPAPAAPEPVHPEPEPVVKAPAPALEPVLASEPEPVAAPEPISTPDLVVVDDDPTPVVAPVVVVEPKPAPLALGPTSEPTTTPEPAEQPEPIVIDDEPVTPTAEPSPESVPVMPTVVETPAVPNPFTPLDASDAAPVAVVTSGGSSGGGTALWLLPLVGVAGALRARSRATR